jgi:hypothetical protein
MISRSRSINKPVKMEYKCVNCHFCRQHRSHRSLPKWLSGGNVSLAKSFYVQLDLLGQVLCFGIIKHFTAVFQQLSLAKASTGDSL